MWQGEFTIDLSWSWLVVVDLVERHTGSCSYIQGLTCNPGNERKTGNVTWEESTPRYTQLDVSLFSIPPSCLTIGHDIGLIQGLVAGSLRSFTQAQKVFRIKQMYHRFPMSVSNGSGPSLQVRVWVQTEPLPNWRSWLSLNLNRQLGYCSMGNSQPICIGWVGNGLSSWSIHRLIYGSCFWSLLIVSCRNRVFNNQW